MEIKIKSRVQVLRGKHKDKYRVVTEYGKTADDGLQY